jgi:hypothetical protein
VTPTPCGYNTIKEDACPNIATQRFNGLDLCEQHYREVVDTYNDIVKNDRELIQDEKGTVYKVNKDKLI